MELSKSPRAFNAGPVTRLPFIALLAEEAVGRIAGEVDNKNLTDGALEVQVSGLGVSDLGFRGLGGSGKALNSLPPEGWPRPGRSPHLGNPWLDGL